MFSETSGIKDHRTLRPEVSLGGTDGDFLFETTGTYGFVASLMALDGGEVKIEALYDKEKLFRVKYPNSMTVIYDYSGNLTKFEMDLVKVYADMPDSILVQMEPGFLMAAEYLQENELELLAEVDLADGLALGDMGGWLQIIADNNFKNGDSGIRGIEVKQGSEPTRGSIEIRDPHETKLGEIYVVSGLIEGNLVVGAGDGRLFLLVMYKRLIDPEYINKAKRPQGARELLVYLMAQDIE